MALRIAEREKPDLVLLDVRLPDMSGYDVFARLRDVPELRSVPVVFLSESGDVQNRIKGLGLGAVDFVPKPFSLAELIARVKNQLAAKKSRDDSTNMTHRLNRRVQRNEALIRSIYPETLASEIAESKSIQPRRHENVAVLIADLVGFTAFCGAHTPEEVLENVQELDCRFEGLIMDKGLEKVNFVGDSVMAAAGLFHQMANPVEMAVHCAIDMIRAAEAIAAGWKIRVGIDFGSVVSGIPGTQRSLLGLFGDPVNTAARVQTAAKPGNICLTEKAWEHIIPSFPLSLSETVELKGKGFMKVFHIEILVSEKC